MVGSGQCIRGFFLSKKGLWFSKKPWVSHCSQEFLELPPMWSGGIPALDPLPGKKELGEDAQILLNMFTTKQPGVSPGGT